MDVLECVPSGEPRWSPDLNQAADATNGHFLENDSFLGDD
jgi:hypothetical protein